MTCQKGNILGVNHSNIGNYLVLYDMLEVVVNARVSQ